VTLRTRRQGNKFKYILKLADEGEGKVVRGGEAVNMGKSATTTMQWKFHHLIFEKKMQTESFWCRQCTFEK
jgi:hypothetical protein